MDSDVTTVQRARGYRRCPDGCMYWVLTDHASKHHEALPDPLADTLEGWWEFGQILKWAHEKGWRFEMDHHAGDYQVSVWVVDHWGSLSEGHPDFRAAIVAALAAAVRRESEEPNG